MINVNIVKIIENLCPERTMIGMSTPIKREGGLAELVSVPEEYFSDFRETKY